jgi:hypothetical protein
MPTCLDLVAGTKMVFAGLKKPEERAGKCCHWSRVWGLACSWLGMRVACVAWS